METPSSSYDLRVHRCKFLSWKPSGIEAMAYSPENKFCAVIRSNSNVEIWKVEQWNLIVTFPGSKSWSLRKVAFMPKNIDADLNMEEESLSHYSIIGSGLNGFMFEFDCNSLQPIQHEEVEGGGIWDFDIYSNKLIATAGDDGFVRIYKKKYNKPFKFLKRLPQAKDKTLSVSWSHDGSAIAAGINPIRH